MRPHFLMEVIDGLEGRTLSGQEKRPLLAFCEALFRTRTGDPLLTMEVLYQLS
jgi:hypothetical protein